MDSNSPGFWIGTTFHLVNSASGDPMVSSGSDQFQLGGAEAVSFPHQNEQPTWVEATWVDASGVVFAWYHQEQPGVCPGTDLTVPHIGAAVSYDGGRTFRDYGTILASGDPVDCSSQNGYFAGGHGDFSVIPDRSGDYFYFLFSNYGGAAANQGVAIARMAAGDRYSPAGKIWKYYQGDWREPGVGGAVTPIFPAKVSWQAPNTNAFWGPSVHWNTYLNQYVVLLNRSCCSTGWPQRGIYASFAGDLADPSGWTKPKKILNYAAWYPQILGTGAGESDSLAGQKARLYVFGTSQWELTFENTSDAVQPVLPDQ